VRADAKKRGRKVAAFDKEPQGEGMTSTPTAIAPTPSSIAVQQQSGAIGALITGIDLTEAVDDATFDLLHRALLDHCVICIRGQRAMTPEDQLSFASRWGEIFVHPYVPSMEGYAGMMRIVDTNPITQTWHSDTTHALRPPSLTLLLARTVPSYGGDTMWSNAYAALEGLSPTMQETLSTLRAVHQGTELAGGAGLDQQAVTATHPVVRTHDETGRKALFVNGNYVTRFEGWTEEESAPLLQFLYAQFAKPEYQYRHHWQVGDLVIWDNRSTQHSVVGDTGGAHRELNRVTIVGGVPR
jgi:taurine dioxygenase